MTKIAMGSRILLYPTPTVLVGANVDGKANFMAVAWCGVVNSRPPMLSVALQHPRHTLKGIRQNDTFSINIPSVDIVRETDYCGLVSGSTTDKVSDCHFHIFSGKIETAPLITECPVNLECRVVQILSLPSHALVVGEVAAAYIDDSCLTNGEPDVDKMKPFLWVVRPTNQYRELGKIIGEAHSIGREISKGEKN
jgi:flavin reductase (DIM6/NTAB) family NADH-FMN oxidoreductase RutF